LIQAKDSRVQFRTRWQEVTDWLKKVDDSVKADDDGANFNTAESQLQEHKVGVYYSVIYLAQFIC
jgi:hypothetical protein